MPQAIPIIVGAVFKGTAYYQAAVLISTVAVGMYESNRAKQKAREAFEKSLSDRLVPVRSGISERVYLIGAARLSGTVMYIETIGNNKESLDIVLAIANNECELVGWYLNEDFIAVADFPGERYGSDRRASTSERFNPVTGTSVALVLPSAPNTQRNPVRVTYRQGLLRGTATVSSIVGATVNVTGLPAGSSDVTVSYDSSMGVSLQGIFLPGTASQPATSWGVGKPSPGWTTDHRLHGVCGVRTLFNWDEKDWETGPANVGASLIGRGNALHPFYDPRNGSNPVSTRNPALVAAWWMTLPRYLGGCGIPSAWIDWQAVSVAANICDEPNSFKNLNGSGYTTLPRYECNTVLSTGDAPLVNLDKILASMAGRRTFTAGLYKIVAGAFRPATLTITDADLIGDKPINASTGRGSDSPPNIVTAAFSDANDHWRERPAKPVRNSDYVIADGAEEPLDIPMPSTTDGRRANYLMGIALEGARPAHSIELYVSGIGENIAIYDTVQVAISGRPHLAGKTFEVIEIDDFWNGHFRLALSEIRPQTWALDPDTYTPVDPVTPVDNSGLFTPAVVAGFSVAAITPQTLPDGTSIMRVDLTWDPLPDEGNTLSARIELRFRVAGGDWIGIASVAADQIGTSITAALIDGEVYQFQARYVNGIGATSGWIDAWTQIDGTPLPALLSLRLRASSTIFRVPQTGNALPISIDLDVVRTGGLTEPAIFTTNPGGLTLGGSGDSRTLAYADLGANESAQITCTVTQGSIDYVDTVTILKLFDGADADTTPDPTPPPVPTGLAVQSFLVHLYVTWTPAAYTQGHGHDATIIYAAQRLTAGPNPTFANAVAVGSSTSSAFAFPAAPGTTWAIWIRHQSRDGYLSPTAGGTNGVQQATAQIGNSNLGPLVIEAGNLVDGAVTGAKISAASVDITKFASGIEPVVVRDTLPSSYVGRTVFLTSDGNLYRWQGTSYSRGIASGDIAGQLSAAQIASVNATAIAGLISGTQIGPQSISTVNLAAGAVTAGTIAAGAVQAGNIAANAVTADKIAANAVDADSLQANAVTAGKIAAGAVSANEIAAGAITASKIAITGRGAALNDDPAGIDATAWTRYPSGTPLASFNVDSSVAPGGKVIRSNGSTDIISRQFPIITGKRYRVSCWARKTSGTGGFYFGVLMYQPGASGSGYTALFYSASNFTLSTTFVRFQGVFDTPPSHTFASVYFTANAGGTGDTDIADLRCEEVIPGELIVDGSITARKLVITGGGGALNDDPQTTDATAWSNSGFTIAQITDTQGITSVIRSNANIGSAQPFSRPVQFNPAKTYRVRCRARNVGGNGIFYLVVDLRDSANQIIGGAGTYWRYPVSGIALPSGFTQYEGRFGAGVDAFPSNARTMAVGALLNYQGSAGYHEITDLLIEECVDGNLIVDGSVTATKIAANAIAVGTAAIQNGAIVNAMIGNAAIDSAKILELTVSKISGGVLGADIQVGAGRITYDNGVVMRAQGTGFGTSSQFVDWYGARPSGGNLALCSESNATYYLKTNGQAYFGGSLSAGTLKNAAQTTDVSATASVEVTFLTNGGNKSVVLSYSYQRGYRTRLSSAPSLSSGSAQIILEKSLNSGSSWTTMTTMNVSGPEIIEFVEPDTGPFNYYTLSLNMGGSQTINDSQGATNNLTYRARVVSRSVPALIGSTIDQLGVTQFTGFISQE